MSAGEKDRAAQDLSGVRRANPLSVPVEALKMASGLVTLAAFVLAPDFFGGVSTTLRYKWISLKADFGYSVGNKAYNALRRQTESMSTFYNQSTAVLNRWQVEGQMTDMPRAAYGDPSGNNIFSDRWIEDASYFKLRALTLAFHFDNKMLRFCQSGTIYVTGENLFTLTDYLGSDPEFNYSYSESMRGFDYAKVALPITIKVGFNLNF